MLNLGAKFEQARGDSGRAAEYFQGVAGRVASG